MYKFVLLYFVWMQLSFFFSIASAALWTSKILDRNMRLFTNHLPLYLAGFGVMLSLQLPFLFLGWSSVRKESRPHFTIFFATCGVLAGLSSATSSTLVYRSLFLSWKFFATITVSSSTFLLLTIGFAIVCRTNFNKGLAQYLRVNETLEGMDFTPVFFPREKLSSSSELGCASEKKPTDVLTAQPTLEQPAAARVRPGPPSEHGGLGPQARHVSVYSDSGAEPVFFSSSPPLLSELDPPTHRTRGLTKSRIRAERRSMFGPGDWRASVYYASSEGSRPNTGESTHTGVSNGLWDAGVRGSRGFVRVQEGIAL